jgi:hypothetical protein
VIDIAAVVKYDNDCTVVPKAESVQVVSDAGHSTFTVTDRPAASTSAASNTDAAVLASGDASTLGEASGSGTASIAAFAAVDPSIIGVWVNSHSHLWDQSNPVFVAPALMQTAYSSLLPIMDSYRRK